MNQRVPFKDLADADLTVGAVYAQGPHRDVRADPLHKLLAGVGNQGGFRAAGSVQGGNVRFAVLYTSGEDPDWPDRLDNEAGVFTYFGDNKKPGSDLHATVRSGNLLLRGSFEALHSDPPARASIPPYFVFRKRSGAGRDVEFLGLAVPGAVDVPATADLVALWRTTSGQRFQNYRATFTVLDVGIVRRAWLNDLGQGVRLGKNCPKTFRKFVETGAYGPLRAPRTQRWRSPAEQEPETKSGRALVQAIHEYFKDDPWSFEACAIELWRMQANESVSFIEGTRRTADGGRDAIGRYGLGPEGDRIELDFSLEAKCYAPGKFSGVRDTSRLISRLRHRQFGVFVTTSGVNRQAYKELREDEHPVVVMCGRDIASLLEQHGHSTPSAVRSWLEAQFPRSST